jgi:hypothetical protein
VYSILANHRRADAPILQGNVYRQSFFCKATIQIIISGQKNNEREHIYFLYDIKLQFVVGKYVQEFNLCPAVSFSDTSWNVVAHCCVAGQAVVRQVRGSNRVSHQTKRQNVRSLVVWCSGWYCANTQKGIHVQTKKNILKN